MPWLVYAFVSALAAAATAVLAKRGVEGIPSTFGDGAAHRRRADLRLADGVSSGRESRTLLTVEAFADLSGALGPGDRHLVACVLSRIAAGASVSTSRAD